MPTVTIEKPLNINKETTGFQVFEKLLIQRPNGNEGLLLSQLADLILDSIMDCDRFIEQKGLTSDIELEVSISIKSKG